MTAFTNELFGTFLLILLILSITDKRNGSRPVEANALLIGLTAGIISFSFAGNTGGAINPARDFMPRLFTSLCGYGTNVFTANNFFFWIPIVAPMIGSVLATFTYSFFIKNSWPDGKSSEKGHKGQSLKNKEIELAELTISE